MSTKSVLQAAIVAAVSTAVSATVARTEVAAQPSSVAPIVEAVAQQVAPVIENATNAEPWYRSRVTIGALVSIIIPLLGLAGVTSDIVDADQLTAIVVAAGSAIGGTLSLYGRWKAKRAIGR